jgi:uncharacterized protein YjbI with pentapeptide repeats
MKFSELIPKTCEYKPKNYDLNINEWVDGYLDFPDYSHATRYEGCGEPIWKDDPEGKYCIYHSKSREKREFQERFTEKYMENFYNSSHFKILHDYIGFVFPEDFNFGVFFNDVRKDPKVGKKIREYYQEAGTHLIDVNFYGAIFYCDAYFLGQKFYGYLKGTNFMYAKFMGRNGAYFRLSEFTGEGQVSFYFAQFIGSEVDFYWTKFSNKERINFSRAIFVGEGQAKFQHLVFKGDNYVDFENTFFSMLNGLSFRYAQFMDGIKVFFRNTQFDGATIVDFRELNLEGAGKVLFNNVDISRCMFSDTYIRNIDFREVLFSTDFSEEPRRISLFKRTRVFDEVLFEHQEEKTFMRMKAFLRESRYKETLDKVIESFGNDRLWEDNLLHMLIDEHRSDMPDYKVLDLHNSLKALSDGIQGTDTNINSRKVKRRKLIQEIINKIEDRDKRDVWWRLIHLIKTDDRIIYQKIRENLDKVEEEDNRVIRLIAEIKNEQYKERYRNKQIYSQLRLNYEDSGRYHEAGEYFVGEMEMRRKGDSEPKWRRRVLYLYKYFSLYGERPFLALIWIFGLWFLFGLFYYFASFYGMVPIQGKGRIIKGAIDNNYFIQSFRISLSNLTLGRIEPLYRLTSNTLDAILKLFETIFGATGISLFILAMNRKFRRTKD